VNDLSEFLPRRNGRRVYKGFRGALGIVHGAGETLRGNIIGAVDTLLGGKHEAEAASLAQRGREEVHTGAERMRGRSKRTTAGQSQEQETAQERGQARQGQTAEQQQPQAAPRRQVQEPERSKEQGQPQREAPPERVEETVQPKEPGPPPVQQESLKPTSERAKGGREDLAGGTGAPETVPATLS
jgi:hypothetical protein